MLPTGAMLMFKGKDMSSLTCMSQWYLNLKLQLPWGFFPSTAVYKQTHAAVSAALLGVCVCPRSTVSECWPTHWSKIWEDVNADGLKTVTSWWKYAKQMEGKMWTLEVRKLLILNLSTRSPSGDPCFELELHGRVRILTFHLPVFLSVHGHIHYVLHINSRQICCLSCGICGTPH